MENKIYNPEETSDSVLADIPSLNYNYAGTGQRFLNWIIDNLVMRFSVSYLSGAALGIVLQMLSPDLLIELLSGERSFTYWLFSYVVGATNYIIYYTLSEKLFKGYTVGKLITGTRVIRQDDGELTFKDALLRSLCRIVPFEVFSALSGWPWHDTWTKTKVVKTR